MQATELRPCDACGNAMNQVVYLVTVEQRVAGDSGVMNIVGTTLELQLCIRCGCGLNNHALPLAIQHRTQQIDRDRLDAPGT